MGEIQEGVRRKGRQSVRSHRSNAHWSMTTHLLLIIHSPIHFVVVTSPEIHHDVLISGNDVEKVSH